jgi:perosamine synthetase
MIPHSRPWVTVADQQAVVATLSGGSISQGAITNYFEQEVAHLLSLCGGVATSSGTSALELALRSLSIGPGDEVLIPNYACDAVYHAVTNSAATPIICDVDENGLLSPESVEARITGASAAIVAVHIFGLPADIAGLNRFGLPVVEDACQSLGLNLDGGPAGGVGKVGVLSFHATKCITTAEGGMVVSNDRAILEQARNLRDGTASLQRPITAPLSDLQASLGQAQLQRHASFLDRRTTIRKRYLAALANGGRFHTPIGAESYLFRFVIRGEMDVQDAIHFFADRDIVARRGVDELLHRILALSDEDFPSSCGLYAGTISVPFYPGLTEDEICKVETAIREFAK